MTKMDEGFESTQLHILTITFSSSPILCYGWKLAKHILTWNNLGQGPRWLETTSKQNPRLVVLCKTTFLCKFVCNKLIDWCKWGKNFGNIVTLSTSSILTWSHPMSFYWTSFLSWMWPKFGMSLESMKKN